MSKSFISMCITYPYDSPKKMDKMSQYEYLRSSIEQRIFRPSWKDDTNEIPEWIRKRDGIKKQKHPRLYLW